MTGANVAQLMPTSICTTPPPHLNEMWEVSIKLRRSGRGAGRPVNRDTHQVSTSQPLLSAMSLIHDACPQHEISTEHPLPALQATTCRVCYQPTTQWPHHPFQPHEQLLMGWIPGGTMMTIPHSSGNNREWQHCNNNNDTQWHPRWRTWHSPHAYEQVLIG